MIERAFIIRLPDLVKGLPQHYFRVVPWPDWRNPADYQSIDECFAAAVARREAQAQLWDKCGGMSEPLRHALGYDQLGSATRARNEFDPVYDHQAAWEFLRRSKNYQRDWAIWCRAREKAQFNVSASQSRLDAEIRIRKRHGIDINFDKPADPFAGDMPKFLQLTSVPARKFRRSVQNYTSYLRVLDGLAMGAPRSEIADLVFPGEGGKKRLERAITVSGRLVADGYKELATRHQDWLL